MVVERLTTEGTEKARRGTKKGTKLCGRFYRKDAEAQSCTEDFTAEVYGGFFVVL